MTLINKLNKNFKSDLFDNGILILNKCKNVLEQIDSNSIDLILTDPPYNIGYANWDEFIDIEEITYQWYRILKDNGSIFCFSGWSFVSELIERFNPNLILNDWIIYDRIKGRGTKKNLVSTREDILWYIKSKDYVFNKDEAYSTIKKVTKGMGSKNGKETRALSNVWTDISPIVPWSKEREEHPTQKPVSLGERIIKVFSNENSLVLDCYMGSGSFIKAANNLNRKFIGIEKNKKFYNISKKELRRNK